MYGPVFCHINRKLAMGATQVRIALTASIYGNYSSIDIATISGVIGNSLCHTPVAR